MRLAPRRAVIGAATALLAALIGVATAAPASAAPSARTSVFVAKADHGDWNSHGNGHHRHSAHHSPAAHHARHSSRGHAAHNAHARTDRERVNRAAAARAARASRHAAHRAKHSTYRDVNLDVTATVTGAGAGRRIPVATTRVGTDEHAAAQATKAKNSKAKATTAKRSKAQHSKQAPAAANGRGATTPSRPSSQAQTAELATTPTLPHRLDVLPTRVPNHVSGRVALPTVPSPLLVPLETVGRQITKLSAFSGATRWILAGLSLLAAMMVGTAFAGGRRRDSRDAEQPLAAAAPVGTANPGATIRS